MGVKSPRFTALELLDRMDSGAYSNLLLASALNEANLSERDRSFVSRLFYGAAERKLTLEYVISLYSNKPLQKLDRSVANILKIGLYQLLYMDSVPDSAAVNETVALAKQCGKASAAGFVNAVLRSFIRDGKKVTLPKEETARMSVEYSCSEELVKRLCEDYTAEKAEELLKNSLTEHKTYLRVNSLKTDAKTLVDEFMRLGIEAEECGLVQNCVSVSGLGSVEGSRLFAEGYFHVQDLSSQMCCAALDPKPGETVLDLCSAPGGKAFTLAEIMGDSGRIIACDLREKRVGLIKKGAERLGISCIETAVNDAKAFNAGFPAADRVLCDVPCSGFGVIRSKPEIKYTDPKAAEKLPQVQYDILTAAARYLKCGGELVYSTCTLSRAENDGVIDRFLAENSGFVPVELPKFGEPCGGHKLTVFPWDYDCEGFFISKIRKVGN